MFRLISTSLLLLALLSFPATAADRASNLTVGQALSETLERDGVARIEVTLDLNRSKERDEEHPAAGSDVHPAVFDIAMMAAPGAMQLDQAGDFHLMKIAASKVVVGQILGITEVVAVHLDAKPPAEAVAASTKASPCPSSSTRACLQTNFSLSANYGGVSGKVAAIGGDSATFWAYGPSNWEVVAKVLNGCGVNNHWWLFAGAAGSSSYTVASTIWLQGGSLALGAWTASNKPILNTQLFSCS